MSKDPAFLLYYQDYAWGTRRMNYEEKGRYMDLLCEQADKGDIEPETFESLSANNPKIKEKFAQNKKGNYFNKRLKEVMEKRKSFCKSRSLNKLGKKHKKITSKSSDKLMGNGNENRNNNKKGGLGEKIPGNLNTPEFKKSWEEWKTHRTEIRHKLTKSTATKQLKALEGFGAKRAVAAIDYSIEKGYQGIFEDKQKVSEVKENRYEGMKQI